MAKKDEIKEKNIEDPYELPEGWKWVRLGDVANWGSGGTPSRKNPDYYIGEIPWIKTGELNDNFVFDSEEKISEIAIRESSAKLFPKGTVAIAMYGATIGKTAIFGIEASTNQACACGICNENISNLYMFYYLRSMKTYFISQAKGGAQPNISQEIIKSTLFPLPPTIEDQQRIVNRIESMFAKLDQAQEKAQAVLDSFETRKAAILHKAFTGELTAKWRKENGVPDDSWEEKTVGECCSEVKVGIVIKPTRYYTEEEMGIPAFRSANVRENHIDDFDWVYINDEGMENEQRSIVHTNDVLVVRSGAPGTACVVTDQFDGYNAIDILIAVPSQDIINSHFLCYYTNSPMGKNIVAEKKRGLGLTHFNVKGYSATPIKVPSLAEQQEIVRILDTILEKERTAKSSAEQVLEQIDLLKKSILARAFRGEL